ncbi:MAG: ABC transporter substrate-binding protein [Chloroflexota bacterium]
MERKLFLHALGMILLLLVAACGGGAQEPEPEPAVEATAGAVEEQAEEVDVAEEPTDAPEPTAEAEEADADDSESNSDYYPVTVEDEFGELTFDAKPERVIVLREELLEMMLVLDEKPVGFSGRLEIETGDVITDHPYLSEEILGTPTYVGFATEPSIERIIELNPDLILFPNDGGADNEAYESLVQVAPTFAFNPQAVGSWKEGVSKLGIIFNKEAEAAEVVAQFESTIEQLEDELTGLVEEVPRVAVIYLPDPSTTFILGRNFALGGLVESLGFTVVEPEGIDLGPFGAAVVDVEALANIETDSILTFQFSEGVQEGFQAELFLEGLDVPVVRNVLDIGRPYTGPISEEFYLEQFQAGMIAAYGPSAAGITSGESDSCEDGFVLFDHEFLATDPVCIPENPERVAALDLASIELMLASGQELIAGSTPLTFFLGNVAPEWGAAFAAQTAGLPALGFPTNLEVLVEVDPDLIVTSVNFMEPGVEEQMAEIAPTVIYNNASQERFQEWVPNLLFAGAAMGLSEEAEALVAGYEERVAALQGALGDSIDGQTVSVVLPREEEGTLGMRMGGSFSGTIFNDVGIQAPEAQQPLTNEASGSVSTDISKEQWNLIDADYLVIYGVTSTPEGTTEANEAIVQLAEDPIWNTLSVVQNEQVFVAGAHWHGFGLLSAHRVLDDMFAFLAGVEPTVPNPLASPETATIGGGGSSAESASAPGGCEAGFRLFDHELLATDPVCVPENPEAVAMFETFGMEAIIALQSDKAVVAGRDYQLQVLGSFPGFSDQIDAVFGNLPDAGFFPINVEVLAEAEPDLIVTYNLLMEQDEQLSAIAPTVYVNLDPSQLTLQRLVDFHSDLWAGQELIDELLIPYEERAAALGDVIGEEINGQEVVIGRYDGDGEGFKLFAGSTPYQVLADAGYEPPAEFAAELADINTNFPFGMRPISLEELPYADRDFLFIYDLASPVPDPDSMSDGLTALVENPIFGTLTVVQEDRLFLEESYWNFNGIFSSHYIIDDLVKRLAPDEADSIPPNPYRP